MQTVILFQKRKSHDRFPHADGVDPHCTVELLEFFDAFVGETGKTFTEGIFPASAVAVLPDHSREEKEKSYRQKQIVDKEIKKIIVVPNKIVNLVV